MKGQAKFAANLGKAMDRYKKALAAGVYGECGNIVADSVEAAPVDTASLRRSHYVAEPDISGSSVSCEFGCGGIDEQYALKVHETHKSKAKFLQNSMNNAKAGAKQNVTAIAKHAFETGNTKITAPTVDGHALGKTPDETPRNRKR